jgi:hypothetical protein
METALAGVYQAHQEGPGALTLLFVGRDGRVGIGLQCEDEMVAVIVGALLANYPNSAAGATRGAIYGVLLGISGDQENFPAWTRRVRAAAILSRGKENQVATPIQGGIRCWF